MSEQIKQDSVDRVVALLRRIAALGTCELEPDKCYLESGPYCGAHDNWIEDEDVIEARELVAELDSKL